MEQKLNINKYKAFLIILKSIPIIWALFILLSTILRCFWIKTYIFNVLCGVSILPIIFIYIASYVFQFCEYHRMFIHYIVVVSSFRLYDMFNPIESINLFITLMIITFIFMIITLYKYLKDKKGGNYGNKS